MMEGKAADWLTLTYKRVDDLSIDLDIYSPSEAYADRLARQPAVPALVYFHGGGLTVGDRRSWFPGWLQTRAAAAGYAFISADYRLMVPSTGHDILEDVQDVFAFISGPLNAQLDDALAARKIPFKYHVNSSSLAVVGTSAGGLLAYLAAVHVSPRPKALVNMYAMGGNFITSHYLEDKLTPFYRGRELLDPAPFAEWRYNPPPSDTSNDTVNGQKPYGSLKPLTGSPLVYHPPTAPIPGYPANPRMLLTRLYLQLGEALDHYVGEHNPSISLTLRAALDIPHRHLPSSIADAVARQPEYAQLIPAYHRLLFPQFGVSADWPPTFLAHGARDTAVPADETRFMQALLERAGVRVEVREFAEEEHSFDYQAGAEAKFAERLFEPVMAFLKEYL